MKRREAREHIFKLLFSGHDGTLPEGGVEYYCRDNEIKGKDAREILTKVENIFSNLEKIDSLIEGNVKGYTFDRISKVSLAAMRLGVYEIIFDETIPDGVAISEAMEIAAEYEDEKTKAFVNGVLGSVARGK
ncbi:MAG: transcription antitermination factor NusB [Clostridia bacterium]|nr:transcription antitermination factor NusB [Clostridia bacterium]